MDLLRKTLASTPAALLAVGMLLVVPTKVEGQEQVCETLYGGQVVCRVVTPEEEVEREKVLGEHAPVEAGIGDVNFLELAGAMGLAGAAFLFLSRITKRIYLFDK